MSDGWQVYRRHLQRPRCWAHLNRKAEGLKDSLDATARLFGERTHRLLDTLAPAVYAARERPPDQALPVIYQDLLADYRRDCEVLGATAASGKARALAREMLNDWDATIRFWRIRRCRSPTTKPNGHCAIGSY